MFKRIKAKAAWLAYGLAPRSLAAVMALYAVRDEAEAVMAAQLAELAQP